MLDKREDALFIDAGKIVIEKDRGSIGLIQRNFKISFNRAERIMLQLFEAGVVGPEIGTKPRKILMTMKQFEEYLKSKDRLHNYSLDHNVNVTSAMNNTDYISDFVNDKTILSQLNNIIVPQSNGTIQIEFIDNLIKNTSCKTTKLILIDDSVINFCMYQDAPHLFIPMISNMEKINSILDWACAEINERARSFANVNVQDLFTYNELALEKGLQTFPAIIIIINEFYSIPTASEENLIHLLLDAGHRGIIFVVFSKFSLKYLSLGAKEDLLCVCTNEQLQQIFSLKKASNYIAHYDHMEGHEFEYFCADILSKNGYKNVEVTRGCGDQGIDIIAYKDGIKYGIQCKCYTADIGNKAVQEAFSGKVYYNCHVAAVLTNRYFTKSARELANSNNVLLWNRDILEKLIQTAE